MHIVNNKRLQWVTTWMAAWTVAAGGGAVWAAAAVEEEKPPPAPVEETLETKDGVKLAVTYYGSNRGKETIPVVLLHMWKRTRADFKELASFLQSQGCAVIVPDLRGHGDSTALNPDTAARLGVRIEKIDAAKLTPKQFAGMATLDMVAVKEFLWKKNNAGELNLNKLVLVGGEMGASVAVEFAHFDTVNAFYGPLQQGAFVRGMVLLSPEFMFKGLNMKPALANPIVQSKIPMLILVGKDNSKAVADANQIHGLLVRHHPDPIGDNKIEKKTLFFGKLDTSLQGTRMLEVKGLNIDKKIAQFIELRLLKSDVAKALTWKELKKPHQ